MAAPATCRVLVCKDAEYTRAFNAERPSKPAPKPFVPTDFSILPLIVDPPKEEEIPRQQVLREQDAYPIAYLRLLRGIDFLLSSDVDVINLSLGPKRYIEEDPLQYCLEYAIDQCYVPVVVAAGNDGPANDSLQPLARCRGTISVGATDKQRKLLDHSSRGDPEGVKPTVVSDGYPVVLYIREGWETPEPGTSFAAARVSSLVPLLRRVLEVALADYFDAVTNAWDAPNPVPLAHFGLADTGVAATGDALPEDVAAVRRAGQEHIVFPRTEARRQWHVDLGARLSSRQATVLYNYWGRPGWRASIQTAARDARLRTHFGTIGTRPRSEFLYFACVSPDIIKRAVELAAARLEMYAPHEVGAGFFDYRECVSFIRAFSASHFLKLLTLGGEKAFSVDELRELDRSLGPLWSEAEVQFLTHWFYEGRSISVAKVL